MLVDPSLGLSEGHAIGLFRTLTEFSWFAPHGMEQFVASKRFPYEGQRYPAVIRKALGADFNVVIAVRNPFNHGVPLVSHMLEKVASSTLINSCLGRCSLMGHPSASPVMYETLHRAPRYRGLTAKKSLANSLTSGSIELMTHNLIYVGRQFGACREGATLVQA